MANSSVIVALSLSRVLVVSQNPDGQKVFAGQCAGNHGADAHGADRGDQKKNFSANCTRRGKLYWLSGNWPKVALGQVVFGGFRIGVLVRLKLSTRNAIL